MLWRSRLYSLLAASWLQFRSCPAEVVQAAHWDFGSHYKFTIHGGMSEACRIDSTFILFGHLVGLLSFVAESHWLKLRFMISA